MSATLILLVIATILVFLAAIPLPFQSPVRLGWLGVFFYFLSLIVGSP